MEYNIEKIRDLYPLKKAELEKNRRLKERLIETKDIIEEDTYKEYFSTYSNNIAKLEKEVDALEQEIGEIRTIFAKKKLEINDQLHKLEKIIKDTNTLHQSKSIDQDEYKKRKKENDLNLMVLEQENKSLQTREHQFESILFHQKSSRTAAYDYQEQDTTSKKGFLALLKHNKPLAIGLCVGLVATIAGIVIMFSNSGYLSSSSESMSSAYQKVYPTRIPVVDGSTTYGFADERGVVVIEPQFDDVRNFSEGYAAVKQKGVWGYIDTEGNIAIGCQYLLSYVGAFSDGLVRVSEGGKYGFVDTNNNVVIPLEYAFAREFKLGLVPVKMGEKWGYVDTNNNVVIDFIYENAYTFRDNGLAIVRIDGAEGFINTSGEYVVEPAYDSVKAYNDGLAAVRKNGQWGYIDTNEHFVVANKYRNAYNFADDYAVVEGSGSFNVIDTNGTILLNIEDYKVVSNLGEGMFTATDNNKLWSLFNVAGDMKIDNNITISSVNMYGNGAIFRLKTPYGYSLYDYSFSLVMNYYFPHTGMYKYSSIDMLTGLQSDYYFFIWYKEETRRYYAFCIYTDGHVEDHFIDYSEIAIRNNSFSIEQETLTTNRIETYDFILDTHIHKDEIITNVSTLNFSIDKDVLSVGSTNFTKVYTLDNDHMFRDYYFDEINQY